MDEKIFKGKLDLDEVITAAEDLNSAELIDYEIEIPETVADATDVAMEIYKAIEENIPPEKDNDIPGSVIDLHEKLREIIDEEEEKAKKAKKGKKSAAKKEPEPEEEPEDDEEGDDESEEEGEEGVEDDEGTEEEQEEPVEKKKAEKKDGEEPAFRKYRGAEKDAYGYSLGTSANALNMALEKGPYTTSELAKIAGCKMTRVRPHFHGLASKGVYVEEHIHGEGKKAIKTYKLDLKTCRTKKEPVVTASEEKPEAEKKPKKAQPKKKAAPKKAEKKPETKTRKASSKKKGKK